MKLIELNLNIIQLFMEDSKIEQKAEKKNSNLNIIHIFLI